MSTTLSCGQVRDGLPESCNNGNPFRIMRGFFTVAKGVSFTETEAAAITNYTSKVIAKTLLPVHNVYNLEDTSIEKKVQESVLGYKKTTHKGIRGYKLSFDLTMDEYKVFDSWMGKNFDIIPYDDAGNIIFKSLGGDNLGGFPLAYFDVEKTPVITEAASMLTMVEIQEEDANDWLHVRHLKPQNNTAIADRWSPKDVKTITKVTLTAGAVAANAFTVNLDYVSTSEMLDGSDVTKVVTGALKDNFDVRDGTGAVVTPTTVVETSGTPGEYTITCTTYTGGTVQLVATASDEKLFESDIVTVS